MLTAEVPAGALQIVLVEDEDSLSTAGTWVNPQLSWGNSTWVLVEEGRTSVIGTARSIPVKMAGTLAEADVIRLNVHGDGTLDSVALRLWNSDSTDVKQVLSPIEPRRKSDGILEFDRSRLVHHIRKVEEALRMENRKNAKDTSEQALEAMDQFCLGWTKNSDGRKEYHVDLVAKLYGKEGQEIGVFVSAPFVLSVP